jgi:uncharacterized membrane protein (DUF4010 family)
MSTGTPTEPAEFMIRMLIALLGGMLIGLERERAQISSKAKAAGSIPGLRSFGLLSMFGALSAYSVDLFSYPSLNILLVSLIAVALIVLLYAYARMVLYKVQGITTYIVLLLTFMTGALAGTGRILESAGVSVLATLTLAMKHPAERAAASIRYNELLAMIEVAALALILGPIVKYFSYQAGLSIIYKTYVFFVIILILSFTSYMTARVWGTRGILYASLLGALVNSEATIVSLAESGRVLSPEVKDKLLNTLTPLVILIAQLKLVLLAVIGIIIFAGSLSYTIITYLLLITFYTIIMTYIISIAVKGAEIEGEPTTIPIESPLSWSTALKSAIAYAIIASILLVLPKTPIGNISLAPMLISFIGGLVSATAVILSLGTALPLMGACSVTSSIMAVLAAVSLNKILYVRTARTGPRERALVYRWAILLSLVPLLMLIIVSIPSAC